MSNDVIKSLGNAIIVADASLKEMSALIARGNEIMQVTNDSEARTAGNLVRDIKSLMKVIDNDRKNYTRILDTEKKRVISAVEKIVKPLSQVLERVGRMAEEYVARKQEASEEAMRIAIEEASVAAEFGDETPLAVVDSPKVQGVRARESWDFEVISQDEVPRQYCSPDPSLIREYIRQSRQNGILFDDLYIPGLKFIKKTTVY